MKTGDIYYNPKEDKLIEIKDVRDFTVCDVEMFIVSFNEKINKNGYPEGPFLGKLKHMLTGYLKIGEL